MYFSYNGTRIRRSKSSLKTNTTKIVTFRSSLLAFDIRETGLFERVSSVQIHFLLFLRYTSPAYEIPLQLTGRFHREYTEPCDWICFPKYCFNSEKLVTAFLFGQSSWIRKAYFFIENCLPRPSRIKFDASTPSESAVAPKSNFLELARHMSEAAFEPGLSARYAG